MITVRVIVRGALDTNSYFYVDSDSKKGVLIDPGAEAEKLIAEIDKNGWKIEKILITHGHFDHIGAVGKLVNVLKVPFFVHENGKKYLEDPVFNLSLYFGENISLHNATFLKDGDEIRFADGKGKLRMIHTPGHTSDSSIFYDQEHNIAFVGDTIFQGSVGATHFPGGDVHQLSDSIFNKIFELPENTILYPGHYAETDVKTEKSRYTNA